METSEFDIFGDERRRAASVCEEFYESATEKNGDNDNNLRHQRAVSAPAQYPTVDILSSSKPGIRRLSLLDPQQAGFGTVTEWIDGATVQTIAENVDGNASQASTGFAWSLYHHTLELFSLLFPLTLAWSIPNYNRQREKSFKKSLGRLFLWGDGFRGGKLESVLDESESLREAVIESLAAIGKILLFKLAPKCLEKSTSSEHQEIRQEIHDLEIFVEKARILTENEYESDRSSILPSTESSESFSLGIANTLKVYVECLMELLPSMEETLQALEYDEFEDQRNHPIDFQVSGPAQPYVLKVYDKFPKADLRLMHRLGEANWQRHISLRTMGNHIEDDEIPWEMPKAVFVAISLFHDSGLGSSLPAQSTYAITTATHSSFQSTAADKDNGDLCVPRTPKQVFDGVPFSCQICGHKLSRIKNRIDWRRHVFADLKPYICTFSSCKDELKTFPTRKLWEEHEFGQHRLNRYWSCSACQQKARTPEDWRTHLEHTHDLHLSDEQYLIAVPSAEVHESMKIDLESCPLCLEVPGKSQRNFATHVGKHMEAIALSALPREEESTDSESMASSVSSTASRRQLTESRRETEPGQKGASRVLSSQFFGNTDSEEEDDYNPITKAQTHSSTSTKLSRENCVETSDSSNSLSKKLKKVRRFMSQQRKELESVPDLDNLDHGNPTNLIFRTGVTDTPRLSRRSLSTPTDTATLETLPRLSARASNRITEHILKPIIANPSLKDFHPIVRDCPRRIHSKEIVCLRDLEKTLIFMAPVRAKCAALYLEFCLASIRCIQSTVEFLSEADQTRPNDRPYTNGYFIEIVDQIKLYAQHIPEGIQKEAKNDLKGEDAEPSIDDEIKLHGGLTVNGRPAELVRVKKNGKAFSIVTGLPIDLSDNATAGSISNRRSLTEEAEDDEAILTAMARRKRSATALELAPKKCHEPGCDKQFKRPYDLTKHEKSHSRLWRCPIESCKYHQYGLPTEKEMDRHFNDKHTTAPLLYECLFKPCPYRSKRESNCKQHMEKAHGWEYVRSQRKGKKNIMADGSPRLGLHFNTNVDFSLYDNEHLHRANVQLPTSSKIFQNGLNMSNIPFGADSTPHILPIGDGNKMLFTPTAPQEVDEGFEEFVPDNTNIGSDFHLFPSSTVGTVASSAPSALFGEIPAPANNFPGIPAQELLDFYSADTQAAAGAASSAREPPRSSEYE